MDDIENWAWDITMLLVMTLKAIGPTGYRCFAGRKNKYYKF